MWWLIIIAIIVIPFIKFLIARNKQADAIEREGGIRTKYGVLISLLLSGSDKAHIVQEDRNGLLLGAGSPMGSTYFSITPTFGNVTIQWISKSPMLGNHKIEWTFNEHMDQELMFEKINIDVEAYMSKVLKRFE